MSGWFDTGVPTLLLGLGLGGLARQTGGSSRWQRWSATLAQGWSIPVLVGLITFLAYGWVWAGYLSPPAIFHDEAAYLFQAELFASFRWTAPSPPVPEAFEQFHLLVTPRFASKYPPGHSLLLAPGVAIGFPALVPLLLSGLSAGLLIGLGRRLIGGGAALVAWALCLGATINLQWRPSYFSEVTTGFLWLAGWYSLLRWRETRHSAWLIAVALSVGWGAITRPLTMLVFAVPVVAIVLVSAWRGRMLRPLILAGGLGVGVLAVLPLWAARTTGDWAEWPVARYTSDYMPFDRLGFGLDSSTAGRSLPPSMQPLLDLFRAEHQAHTPSSYPGAVGKRALHVARETWSGWRIWLAPAALIGLVSGAAVGWVGAATAAMLLLTYGFYAHPDTWTLYYLEMVPIAVLLTAAGLATCLRSPWAGRILRAPRDKVSTDAILTAIAGVALLLTIPNLAEFHGANLDRAAPHRSIQAAIAGLPAEERIVIVRRAGDRVPHDTFVSNPPDLGAALTWFVSEDAPHLATLLQMAPTRALYLLDLLQGELLPITRPVVAADSTRQPPP